MQQHMADPTIRFHHCSEDGYATNYKLEDHVKLCLKKEEIGWLWNHGKHGSPVGHHCQNGEGEPHLGPEGLLVCCPCVWMQGQGGPCGPCSWCGLGNASEC